jgi:hypothetical protein
MKDPNALQSEDSLQNPSWKSDSGRIPIYPQIVSP